MCFFPDILEVGFDIYAFFFCCQFFFLSSPQIELSWEFAQKQDRARLNATSTVVIEACKIFEKNPTVGIFVGNLRRVVINAERKGMPHSVGTKGMK